ncbi:hypothetical protein PG997_012546 [Apiospora hydei]|uniref:Uncharacterized protein n=1 Tax=Apiospora hydei TaxID=1337664 RepID=A0ABR1V3N6_9PEZI
MSNTKGTSEKVLGPHPADQVADFPPRNATTTEVREWLRHLLEQRQFSNQEVREYLPEVRLNGEDLLDLDLDEDYLFNILPKVSEEDYEKVKSHSSTVNHFEQMRDSIYIDILRASWQHKQKVDTMILEVSKRSEIDQQSTMFRKICYGVLLVIIVACFIVWY